MLFDPDLLRLRRARARRLDDDVWQALVRDEVEARATALPGPIAAVWRFDPDAEALPEPGSLDAIVVTRGLETFDDLPALLAAFAALLKPGRPLIGALIGGDSVPRLRRALIEADTALGRPAAPRAHPRVDPAALAGLLSGAGFADPVVDVERLRLSYASLDRLVADLRGSGLTNTLATRSKFYPGRVFPSALGEAFMDGADDRGRVEERLDLLHFLAFAPQQSR